MCICTYLGLNFVPTFDNIIVHPKHGNIMVIWWCLPVKMGMAFHLSTIKVHVHGYVAFPASRNGHGIPPVHHGSTCAWSCGVPCRPEWTRHSACPPWRYMCMVMWHSLPAGMDTEFHLSTVVVHVHGHVAFPTGRNEHGIPPVHLGSSCAWSCGVSCRPE